MVILIIFAFLGGIVTILSPCILPILPIVLSGSLTGGKRRPFGIIVGFIASFTFFTLFLTTLVRLLGFSADVLRTIAVVTVFVFGLSMLLPQTQILLEKFFSKLQGIIVHNSTPQQQDTGFMGGLFLGATLGLVWTPCVGPILASVITLAVTSQVSLAAVFITLAYSAGTAIPLFLITLGGRQLLQKHPWLLKNSSRIQKAFGILMVLTATAIYFNLDRNFQSYILQKFPQYGVGLTSIEDNPIVRSALEKLKASPMPEEKRGKPMFELLNDLGKARELIQGGAWFNLPACAGSCEQKLTLQELRGKVVLIDFWTYTCINCIRTLPYLKSWDEKYRSKGLTIIGVHTPEFEFEKEYANVEKAILDFGIKYPVMQDNDYATWRAYNNRYWPAKYLIDKEGKIRYTHFGEGKYDETEKIIQELLAEAGTPVDETIDNPEYQIQARTPELYLGYKRIEFLASPEIIQPDTETSYSAPTSLPKHYFSYAGTWTIGGERAMPSQNAVLELNFEAREVFLVMRPKNGSSQIRVYLDDQLATTNAGDDVINGVVTIDTDRLYKLIKLSEPGTHRLKLEFLDDNLELYAFTFG